MDAPEIALITLALLFGAAAFGIFLHPLLPPVHRGKDTQKVVKLGVGMVITVASLVLSLFTYSVKTNFDATETNIRAYAASLILLDHSLRAYGPGAEPIRDALRAYTENALRSTWPEQFSLPEKRITIEDRALTHDLFAVQDMIRRLPAPDAREHEVAAECLSNVNDVLRRRFTLIEQVRKSIPPLMLWGVIAWMGLIFLSFGLNAPRNPVVVATMALCALAISSSIYLVDEMDTPLNGIIKVSSKPMRDALAHQLE